VGLFQETEKKAVAAAEKLVKQLSLKKQTLALAESCTGGLISELVTRVSGASAVLWGSFVCYTPSAKELLLGIDNGLLERFGVVSGETVTEMARKALKISGASVAAAVTGLAGPLGEAAGDGGGLPVGTVWIAVAVRGDPALTETLAEKLYFEGTRAEVRMQAALAVLEELCGTGRFLRNRLTKKL
jgi:nicotinamide-nucleotide amidase